MRAAIYTRISQDSSGKALGVERQLDDCKKLAESLNWEVAHTFSDNDISAYSGKVRPGYEALLEAMERGEVDALIAWHTDRLHRSPVELERFISIADRRSVDIRTVQGGDLDLSNASGRMVARILGSVARQESEHSSERRKRANEQKAARGEWQTSRRPFGYTSDGVPLEPEASAVRSAAKDVLSGKSIRQVAREWNEQGLRTAHGGMDWRGTSLRRILRNPRYAALRVHDGKIVGPGTWEALIEPDDHRALLAYLGDPARAPKVSFERRWQGSGVYLCGVCGRSLILHSAADQRRSYKCPDNHVRRQGEAVDAFVDGVVLARLSQADAGVILDRPEVDAAALQVDRDKLQARSDLLGALVGQGEMDVTQFRRASAELKPLIEAVDTKLAAARESSPLVDLMLSGESLEQHWLGMSPDMRGKVIDALVTVTVLPSPKGQRKFNPGFVRIDWR